MKAFILRFFNLQRWIFGVCPRSGEFFRLSDCKLYTRTKPVRDWMDKLDETAWRLEEAEKRLNDKEEEIRERAREKGRKIAQAMVRTIDPVFTPRHLDPDDAKVLFHPVDYVVFQGMKSGGSIDKILLLDRETKSPENRRLQHSIEKTIERGNYEWLTLRVQNDGSIQQE